MATKISKEELERQYEEDLAEDERVDEEEKPKQSKKKGPILPLVEILKFINSDSEEEALKGSPYFSSKCFQGWSSLKEQFKSMIVDLNQNQKKVHQRKLSWPLQFKATPTRKMRMISYNNI